MVTVIDVGNTRTKWATLEGDGRLINTDVAINADIESSPLEGVLAKSERVVIGNVAGDAMQQALVKMMPHDDVVFATVSDEACGVINQYAAAELGIDRWASVIAAWHMKHQPIIVVNAGTAITVEAVAKDNATKKGVYMGGVIMPGMRLMHEILGGNAARLPVNSTGRIAVFPKHTEDAIATGCQNAIVGAVVLQLKKLEKHCAFLPKVVISGGDAVRIAESLNMAIKQVVVSENLVLQGLGIMAKENV